MTYRLFLISVIFLKNLKLEIVNEDCNCQVEQILANMKLLKKQNYNPCFIVTFFKKILLQKIYKTDSTSVDEEKSIKGSSKLKIHFSSTIMKMTYRLFLISVIFLKNLKLEIVNEDCNCQVEQILANMKLLKKQNYTLVNYI
jgi:redox-regulated HSP33 family molecular chaperone